MSSMALTKKKISADLSAENFVWIQDAAKAKKMSVSSALDTLISLYRESKHYELTDEQAERVKQIVDENFQRRLDSKVRRAEIRLEELKAQRNK